MSLQDIPSDLYLYFGIYSLVTLSRTSKRLYQSSQKLISTTNEFAKELDKGVCFDQLMNLLSKYNHLTSVVEYALAAYRGDHSIKAIKQYFKTFRDESMFLSEYGFRSETTISRLFGDNKISYYNWTKGYFFWITGINFDVLKDALPIEMYIKHIDSYLLGFEDWYADIQAESEKVITRVIERLIEIFVSNMSPQERKAIDQKLSFYLMKYSIQSDDNRLDDWHLRVGRKTPFSKTLWFLLKWTEKREYESMYTKYDIEYKIEETPKVQLNQLRTISDIVHATNLTLEQSLEAVKIIESKKYYNTIYFDDAMPNIFLPYVWIALTLEECERYENHLRKKIEHKLGTKIHNAKYSSHELTEVHSTKRIKICYSKSKDILLYFPKETVDVDPIFKFWLDKCCFSDKEGETYSYFPPLK